MPASLLEALSSFMELLIQLLPNILFSVIVLVVGYLVGKVTSRAVSGAVKLVRGDESFEASEVGRRLTAAGYPISRILSILVRLTIYTITILAALSLLKIPVIQEFSTMIAGYLPRLVGAIVVFLLGAMLVEWLASLMEGLMRERAVPERVTNLLTVGLRYFMYLTIVFMTFEIADIAPHVTSSVAQAVFLTLAIGVGLASALLVGMGLREEAPILLLNEPRGLKRGMVIEVRGRRGRVKSVSTLLVEIEDEEGGITVIPKRVLVKEGFRVLTE